jgi:hypothetical protein
MPAPPELHVKGLLASLDQVGKSAAALRATAEAAVKSSPPSPPAVPPSAGGPPPK